MAIREQEKYMQKEVATVVVAIIMDGKQET